jgi:hypothetical protein
MFFSKMHPLANKKGFLPIQNLPELNRQTSSNRIAPRNSAGINHAAVHAGDIQKNPSELQSHR